MDASSGAKMGTSIRWATSGIAPMPTARPNTAIPIGSPMAISEPNATSRIAAAAAIPASSPTPPDSSKAKNRSPPVSISRPGRSRARERLQRLEVGGAERFDLRVLQQHDRHPAVG